VVHYSFGAIFQKDFIFGLPSAGLGGFSKECSLNRFRAALRNGLFVPGHQSLTQERTRKDASTRFRTYGFRSPEGRFAPNARKNTLRQSRNQITGNLTARTQRGLVHRKIAKATKTDFRNSKGLPLRPLWPCCEIFSLRGFARK
jgi:hypothetical protein